MNPEIDRRRTFAKAYRYGAEADAVSVLKEIWLCGRR